MDFETSCNICFKQDKIKKLNENNYEVNILISFVGCPEFMNDSVFLCTECCTKLDEYNKFREMCFTNFIRFPKMYNKLKKKLENENDPCIKRKLKNFTEANVYKQSGVIVVDNFEDIETDSVLSKNDTGLNMKDIQNTNNGGSFIEFDETSNENVIEMHIKEEIKSEILSPGKYPFSDDFNDYKLHSEIDLEKLGSVSENIDTVNPGHGGIFESMGLSTSVNIISNDRAYNSKINETNKLRKSLYLMEQVESSTAPNGKIITYRCLLCQKLFKSRSGARYHQLHHKENT